MTHRQFEIILLSRKLSDRRKNLIHCGGQSCPPTGVTSSGALQADVGGTPNFLINSRLCAIIGNKGSRPQSIGFQDLNEKGPFSKPAGGKIKEFNA